MNNLIFIESQVTKRDLYSRLLLAVELAYRGCCVIVGRNTKLQKLAKDYTHCSYIIDHFTTPGKNRIKDLKDRSHTVFAFCEESTSFSNEDLYLKQRIDCHAIGLLDRVFATNKYHERMIKNKCHNFGINNLDHIKTFGLPRYDLVHKDIRYIYDDKIRQIKNKYGSFVLIPSNGFIDFNNDLEPKINKWVNRGDISVDIIDKVRDYYKSMERSYTAFIKAVLSLAEKTEDINYVYRPKPTENKDELELRYKNKIPKNIIIDSDFNVHPWVLSCDLIIHNNCTTGIEAYLAGKPVVNFTPGPETEFYSKFASKVSVGIDNLEDLVSFVLSKPYHRKEMDHYEKSEYLPNLIDLSYNLICDDICSTHNYEDKLYNIYPYGNSVKEKVNKYLYELRRDTGRGGDIKYNDVFTTVKKMSSRYKRSSHLQVEWIGKELIQVYLKK